MEVNMKYEHGRGLSEPGRPLYCGPPGGGWP